MPHNAGTMIDMTHIDTDVWEVPADWWERAAVTRGVSPHPKIAPIGETAEYIGELTAHRDKIRVIIDNSAALGAPDLAAAATAALEDAATATPLGAAVLGCALQLATETWYHGEHAAADWWMGRYGPVFAAEAAVRLSGLRASTRWRPQERASSPAILHCRADDEFGYGSIVQNLWRVRALLADLSAESYDSVVARLGELRPLLGDPARRAMASVLLPTESDWVAADLACAVPMSEGRSPYALLAASVTSREQLDRLAATVGSQLAYGAGLTGLYTALTRLWPDGAAAVDHVLGAGNHDAATVRLLAGILAELPGDKALAALLARAERRHIPTALAAAVNRSPQRALRVLGPAAQQSGTARHILRALVLRYPDLAAELPAAAVLADSGTTRVATDAELPDLLRNPPWKRPQTTEKPVVTDLPAPRPLSVAWAPGERESWGEERVYYLGNRSKTWNDRIDAALADDSASSYLLPALLAAGPEEVVRPYLATARPKKLWGPESSLRRILAVFDSDGVDFVFSGVQTRPARLATALAPITGTAATALMARWLTTRRFRPLAVTWFDRHHTAAIPDLLAAALGKAGKERRIAESALRALAERGHRVEILSAADAISDRVGKAIRSTLDADPVLRLPAKIPRTPGWLTLELLPAVPLRDSGAALPLDSVHTACTMFMLCAPTGDYAGVPELAAVVDADALTEFAWAVFEQWRLADYPAKDGWVLHALGLVGNEETARRLGPYICRWPGSGATARAVTGLDVLTAIGGDVALMQLHGIADTVKYKGLREKAQERIEEVANGLGLSPEELADRLVPTFGLSAAGTLVLDYGPRGFLIGFDEQLRPTIWDVMRDPAGRWCAATVRAALPKPGPKDDPESAATVYRAFTTLRKEVKAAADQQIRRFERAMVEGRRWNSVDFQRLFVDHPLLWHLTRRLVWAAFDSEGTVTGSFRVAEDRTLAGAADEPITITEDTLIGIAHPLHLRTTAAAWGEVFADYEILQPFPQLQREIHTLAPEETTGPVLERYRGRVVPTGRLLGMRGKVWERDDPAYSGVTLSIIRALGDSRSVVLDIEPGIVAGSPLEYPEQRVVELRLARTGHEDRTGSHPVPSFAELDPITISEILRDMELLLG